MLMVFLAKLYSLIMFHAVALRSQKRIVRWSRSTSGIFCLWSKRRLFLRWRFCERCPLGFAGLTRSPRVDFWAVTAPLLPKLGTAQCSEGSCFRLRLSGEGEGGSPRPLDRGRRRTLL